MSEELETPVEGQVSTEEKGTETPTIDFKTMLSEDILSHPSMASIPDVPTLAKNYVNQQSLIGRKGVILPKEGDKDDWERFVTQLGRPETPDKYEVKLEIPKEMKAYVKDENLTGFKSMAHKYGLTQAQFEGIAKEYTQANIAQVKSFMESNAEAQKTALNNLVNEWGANAEANMAAAKEAMVVSGMSEEQINANLSNADSIKAFANIGKLISGDSLKGGDTGVKPMTEEQINSEIREMIDSSDSPLHDGGHRDHKQYLSRLSDLYKMRDSLRGKR